MSKQFPLLDEFVRFVNERWAIHERRLRGEPAPWTKNPILQKYRFTNVMREHDRVTIWIHKNWLQPHSTDYDTVVFAMALARLVNLPSMLEVLGYPLRWDAKRFVKLMDACRASGATAFNGAYMINAVGAAKGQSKASYLADQVLGPLWKERKYLGQHVALKGSTLAGLQDCLMTFHGFGGGFMSAQVVADVKHLPSMRKAPDWFTFARSGPGSRRGLNWVTGRDVIARWNEVEWYEVLVALHKATDKKLAVEVNYANLQNCLCEFSKYCKVKFAGGRAKQQFRADTQPYV